METLTSPIHMHVRYLTGLTHLPPHLQAVARPFEDPGRALAHEDGARFESFMGDHPALANIPTSSIKEMLDGLPPGAMRRRARAKVKCARAKVKCGDFAEALHLLIEAKDCAVRALVK